MNQGYIKIHRCLCDDPIWVSEPFTKGQAWIDLIILANHKPGHIRIRGNRIELSRGMLAYSELTLAARWKWSRGKTSRFLSELSSPKEGKIIQHKTRLTTIITILNYDKYQSNDTTDRTTDGQQTGQQTDINKNDKNEKKNIKDIKTPPYSGEFELFWKAYPKHTAKKNAWAEWRKLNGTRPDIETIIQAIENQKAARARKISAGQFAPEFQDPERWIKRERWNDEVEDPETAKQMSLELIRAELEERKRGI